ncbi:MAG: 50S ribosomal protein L16 [Methanosarcinales archaeon Met12]|nr:MAG: 50S ribosomal protein L16 [Methanosarcinales archaeon Met12]
MVRKPARMYRALKDRAYTRKTYMGGIPGSKIVQFDMGNLTDEFPVSLTLMVMEACQVRDSSLEAARVSANRLLLKEVGRLNYHLKLNVFPHHVLRENKQATGAGADRISDGMRKAFGKAVGTAARVHQRQKIMTLGVHPQHFNIAKDALRRATNKLPTPCRIVVDKGEELIKSKGT